MRLSKKQLMTLIQEEYRAVLAENAIGTLAKAVVQNADNMQIDKLEALLQKSPQEIEKDFKTMKEALTSKEIMKDMSTYFMALGIPPTVLLAAWSLILNHLEFASVGAAIVGIGIGSLVTYVAIVATTMLAIVLWYKQSYLKKEIDRLSEGFIQFIGKIFELIAKPFWASIASGKEIADFSYHSIATKLDSMKPEIDKLVAKADDKVKGRTGDWSEFHKGERERKD